MDEFATTFMKMLLKVWNDTGSSRVSLLYHWDAFRWNVEGEFECSLHDEFLSFFSPQLLFLRFPGWMQENLHNKRLCVTSLRPWNSWILIIWQLWWKNSLLEIYRCIREEIFVIPKRPRKKYDGDIQYHFDFGLEYSPRKRINPSSYMETKLKV
jgi:hypothetical protein